MLVANSFDLWQKDAFFSAAEEVQQSADIMESAYRTWLRERREELSPMYLDELCRELQMALGTAKWQLEEFEKAVRMSYKHRADEITITRHKQFVSAIENKILDVEAALRESFNVEGKQPLQWVTLDENERDDLALFLSGASATSQSMKDGYTKLQDLTIASPSGKDNVIHCYNVNEASSKRDTQNQAEGCEDSITYNIDLNCPLQKEVEEIHRTRHDVSYATDRTTGAKRSCNINSLEIVVDDNYGQRNTSVADIESTPKEKGLRPFLRRSRRILSYTQLRRFCWINQFLARLNGRHRQVQSPLTFPFSCSIRFTLILMLTIFLVVPFLFFSA